MPFGIGDGWAVDRIDPLRRSPAMVKGRNAQLGEVFVPPLLRQVGAGFFWKVAGAPTSKASDGVDSDANSAKKSVTALG